MNSPKNSNISSGPKLIVALDFASKSECLNFVDGLDPALCRLKIGKEMFTYFGPSMVEEIHARGFDLFLDLKFHDIPNTVAKAVRASAELGVWMVNVHASGGQRMMEAAREALANVQKRPILIAVTVLTSIDENELRNIGVSHSPETQVTTLANLAKQSGLDGVVSSAQEANLIKKQCGDDFLCITPGIRPTGSELGDQKRVMTPAAAIQGGSDFIVVGRPITQAESPVAMCRQISEEISPLSCT